MRHVDEQVVLVVDSDSPKFGNIAKLTAVDKEFGNFWVYLRMAQV